MGTNFSNYFTKPEKAKSGYEQVFKEGEVRDYPLEIKHKNGHTTPVLYHASVYRDESGEVIGVFAAARDVTEIEKAYNNLEMEVEDINAIHNLNTKFIEGNDLDSILQEVLNAAIIILYADKGNIQLLDPSTENLKIVVHDNYKSRFLNFFESVSPEEPSTCGTAMELFERAIVEDINKSPIFQGTDALKVLLDEGTKAVQSTPIISRTGELLGMISTHFDKVHKPAERELRFIDILARQTADIIQYKQAEEQLKEAIKELKRSNKELQSFAYITSHDL